MKITFNTVGTQENEKQYSRQDRSGKIDKDAYAYQVFAVTDRQKNWMQGIGTDKEKGKSLIELQQDAANTNVGITQDYMIVMSHTMSREDYAKLSEEGFHFQEMDPEEAVTIVDKIKAELARSGQCIQGYNDDLDIDTLTAVVGSDALAKAIADSFQAANVPFTQENLDGIVRAWDMANQLEAPTEGVYYYMIDNGAETEIWDFYLAQNSGAQNMTGMAPRYYAEEIQGYYTESVSEGKDRIGNESIQTQLEQVIVNAGFEVTEENYQVAKWLVDRHLPVTAENLQQYKEIQSISFPVSEEAFAKAAANAILEGKDPVHGNLKGGESIYEKAASLMEKVWDDSAWESALQSITARKQLEEIRLRMTAEVNVKLLKSGFAVDTAPMEQLLEALKKAEAEIAEKYFPEDNQAVEKYQVFHQAEQVIKELPQLPAGIIGSWSVREVQGTVSEFHAEGRLLQDSYIKAQESYESLMTSPRRDMGDSMQKAFGNVDDILLDLDMELSWENRRAVRILGYNNMEILPEKIEQIKEADAQVRNIIEKMTPAATLKMIRDGVNPLEKTFSQLEDYFAALPEAYEESAESYSHFLYRLEQNKGITAQERQAYIGIYRLLHQIEKSDGAIVGALVNSQAQLQFQNLLSAVRSAKFRHMNVQVTDETGLMQEIKSETNRISDQIDGGIQAAKAILIEVENFLTNVSGSDFSGKGTIDETYYQNNLTQLRQAVQADEQVTQLLQRGEMPVNADNLLAAQGVLEDPAAPFKRGRAVLDRVTHMSHDKTVVEAEQQDKTDIEGWGGLTELEQLWDKLDEKATFTESYHQVVEEMSRQVETVTWNMADTSMDVKELQLIHKQMSVLSKLADNEEYILPMYVGEDLAKVHLTIERGQVQKGMVAVKVNWSNQQCVEAHLQLQLGKISGFLIGNSAEEVTKLQAAADIFHELVEREASVEWEMGDLPIINTVNDTSFVNMAADGEKNAATGNVADNAELYRVAKLFLQAFRE